jgi:hypothetical protein
MHKMSVVYSISSFFFFFFIKMSVVNLFIYLINVGVRASLRASRLILRALKLTAV